MKHSVVSLATAAVALCVGAVKVSEIQGPAFQSPLAGQWVRNVTGLVTAKDRFGFWIMEEPSNDTRVSSGLRVYSPSIGSQIHTGDHVSVSGHVSEYRQASRPNDLFLTELDLPYGLVIYSTGNPVPPLKLGRSGNRTPPSTRLSAHDLGVDSWLSIPNNVTRLESANNLLEPDKYGLDFWESLEGMLITIPNVVSSGFPDMFGSIWVYGDWDVEGKNERGGLTLTYVDDTPDAHPGTILVGRPLDGTMLPKTSMGMGLSDITGVVTYQFGFYYVLPLTTPTIISSPQSQAAPAVVSSGAHPCDLSVSDYNVENMSPRSHHIPHIAEDIVNYLHSPDIVFLQEIQDDSGSRDNGVVTANKTLAALVRAISKAQSAHPRGRPDTRFTYNYVDISPENNLDGGKAGGNIRVAYLWRPDKVSLLPGQRGNATEATKVTYGSDGRLTLSLNPGRINPASIAWEDTRKPLAAVWQTATGERFYTVNVHLSSKRDSSSQHGDARPPINGHSDRRTHQVNVTMEFVGSILAQDSNASVIVAGDMNEFLQTRSVFRALRPILHDINDVSHVPPVERYTYVYEQNTQEIDHMFISTAVALRGAQVEHVHVNTWARNVAERASDHDPTVARVWVCNQPLDNGHPLVLQSLGY